MIMVTCWERCESRGSRTVLREADGEVPLVYSPLIPLSTSRTIRLTIGQRVAAMILNALGFVGTRLYMFPEFMHSKTVTRLFGKGIQAEDFNEYSLGRGLDIIYKYGVTKLFITLMMEITTELGLVGKTARIDTTSIICYGDYSEQTENTPDELNPEPFNVTYGYSKDGRPDLKQVIIALVTTGDAKLPLFMASLSGNAADQSSMHQLIERMDNFVKNLQNSPSFLYVGDSAIYNSCINKNHGMLWLTRVPQTNNSVKQFLLTAEKDLSWHTLDSGYKISHSVVHIYKAVPQRRVIVFSEQLAIKHQLHLVKLIDKEWIKKAKELKKLKTEQFVRTKDAVKAAKKLSHAKYHTIHYEITTKTTNAIVTLDKKITKVDNYQVTATITQNNEAIQRQKKPER